MRENLCISFFFAGPSPLASSSTVLSRLNAKSKIKTLGLQDGVGPSPCQKVINSKFRVHFWPTIISTGAN